jgi:hypothetical protein
MQSEKIKIKIKTDQKKEKNHKPNKKPFFILKTKIEPAAIKQIVPPTSEQ